MALYSSMNSKPSAPSMLVVSGVTSVICRWPTRESAGGTTGGAAGSAGSSGSSGCSVSAGVSWASSTAPGEAAAADANRAAESESAAGSAKWALRSWPTEPAG